MTTTLFTSDTLLNEVMPDVPGCSLPIAKTAIRNAVIELCNKSKVWVTDHAPIDSVALQAAYPFAPATETLVCAVITAYYDGRKMEPAIQTDIASRYDNWTEKTGTPTDYLQESESEIILFKKPDAAIAGALTMKVALKPTRAANGVESWIVEKYLEEIAHGAKAKLFAMQKKPWTDSGLSAFHLGEFSTGIARAKIHAAKSLGRGRLRTTPRFL